MTERKHSLLLDETVFEVLDRYARALQTRVPRRKNGPRVSLSRLAGAILADFVLAHEQEILTECDDAESRELVRKLSQRLQPDELELVGIDPATIPPKPAAARRR